MLFIECLTSDNGTVEYFNLSNIISIKPLPHNKTKLLFGAGLYYTVVSDSIRIIDSNDINDIFNNYK